MIPNDHQSESGASSTAAAASRTPQTLPPPEWSMLSGGPSSARIAPGPLIRRVGARAEEAWLRARVEEARASGDRNLVRSASVALARWLASRDRDLDEAVELAASALQIQEDVELRRELSAWLEGLGEPARAATVLRPITMLEDVESAEAAEALVRVGLLRSRAGAAGMATAAFDAALAIDAIDPLAGELLGTISAWQPDIVSIPAGVEAYIEAARRNGARGQDDAETENLWRALTADSSSEVAVAALAGALERRGRSAASEEIRRSLSVAPADSGNATRDPELTGSGYPTNARVAGLLADSSLAEQRDPREGVAALERAIAMIGPRIRWCIALADTLDALGEADLAAGWTARCVALRPGDQQGIILLLGRLLRAGDASRLRDALGWLLMQPQPTSWSAEPFAQALSALARLDIERAGVVGRRALEVFGPKSAALREAMLHVAELASDDAFAVAVIERWLSCGAGGADRARGLLRLTGLYERLADDERRARTFARAVREGVQGLEIDRLTAPADGATADGQVWRLRAIAEHLSAGDDPAEAAGAWRDLGAALWDLADDRGGAIDAWQRAARVAPGGFATLTLDLIACGGTDFAFEYLLRLVELEPDDSVAAAIAAEIATAALSAGEANRAFDVATRGVARSPQSSEALAAAERAAQPGAKEEALSATYDLIAARALGRFGRRAAHYRAARFFERSGDWTLALKHAARAFLEVPSEGATFQFLARTAERANDLAPAVQAVEQVALSAQDGAARAIWLMRAASIAGDDEAGIRRKIQVLFSAALAAPRVATIGHLQRVARQLLAFSPKDRAGLELRFGDVADTIGQQVHGPDGARINLAFAAALIDLFGDSDGALTSIERAFACDAAVDEFGQLLGDASRLGRAPNVRERIARLLATADLPHANVGVAGLRLIAAVGDAVGDGALRSRASLSAALRAPDDDGLVIGADDAVRAQPELAARIGGRISPARRAAALVAAAHSRIAAGALDEAPALFERAADLLDGASRASVEHELRAALDAAGRGTEVEARALREALADTRSAAMRGDSWMDIAELREDRGDHAGALKALLEACALDPAPLRRWSALERVAELAGDGNARIAALEKIETRVGSDGRPMVLKRLARAHERRSDLETAELTWRRVLEIDPDDDEADRAIQALLGARGQYEASSEHLSRRAERLASQPDKREILRAVRLRRAAILEQRLGRSKEACDELELLLREWPNSVGALRYLADLLDRQSDFTRSAELWRRAAALEGNAADSEELELRALRALRAEDERARTPSERGHSRLTLARRRLASGDTVGAEPSLWEALADGMIEAGDVLAPLLASSPDRASELVRVRWQQVLLEPGDIDRLESLRVAAIAAGDPVHALAVEHVLRAFDPHAAPVVSPPLDTQPEQPGIVTLLIRPSMEACGEAIAIVWEGAMRLFVRDAASYGITGVERVVAGPSSPVAHLYEVAMRILDVPRIPLFVTRSQTGSLESRVALLSPPAVILAGDIRGETMAVRFELGQGIAAALSCNVLRSGLPGDEARAVVEALQTAFGPPELGRPVGARAAHLAESFWEMIPARGQRRLQELLRGGSLANYDVLMEAGRQTGRRLGMFLAGDFGFAARMLLADLAGSTDEPITNSNLRTLCARLPALADLLCLAVRSEYANARWHSVLSASPQRSAGSGHFSLY